MKRREKFLVLCVGGAVRSVTLANILKYWFDHDALAASLEKNDAETLAMLYAWAEHIVVVEESMTILVPERHAAKVKFVPIGPDVWAHSNHEDLIEKIIGIDLPAIIGVSRVVWEKRHKHFESWKRHKTKLRNIGDKGSHELEEGA